MGAEIVKCVRIETRTGPAYIPLLALIGPFAIHATTHRPENITVTHLGSGLALASDFVSLSGAERAANGLIFEADWNFTDAGALDSWTRYRRDKVRGLIRAFLRDDGARKPTSEGGRDE